MLFGTFMLSSLPTPEALAQNGKPIDPDQKYAWSSNAGWLNFRPVPAETVKIYPDHLEGYVWGEKIGWIKLGSYSDGEEHTYQNNSRDNWGVNNDGSGKLSGYAWSTNVGWINFNPKCDDCPTSVTINPTTGNFEGYAWSTTVGWINFQSRSGLALTTPTKECGELEKEVKKAQVELEEVNKKAKEDAEAAETKLAAALKAQKIAVKDIQLGLDHSCLLTTTGNVKCWGSNKYGQLGDGTTEAQKKPVTTVSGLSGVRAIAVGAYHSCALTTTGGVKCWGKNEYGQLGNGEFGKDKYKNGPVPVSGLNGVREIVLGYSYSCALTTTGKVKCWGRNYYGQLGSGNDRDQPYPAESNYLSGVRALGAGTHHSCVVTKTGNVMCLGAGESGQFGDGTFTEWREKSEKVLNLSGVRAVALGNYHSCALTTTGGVKCWGSNQYGQLGDGTTTGKKKGKNKPVKVDLSSVRAIELGNHHSCALTTTDVMCWGENDVGQLGDNTSKQQNKPVKVFGLSGVSAIAVGAHHSCALTMTGGVKCWGYNFSGQLGNGRNINSEIPVDVQLDSD